MNAPLRMMAALWLAGAAAAQEQATTLQALAARADAVALATAVAATDPSPMLHRVTFRVDAVLAGAPGAAIAVAEPAGRCCGRALPAVTPGASYVLFLARGALGLQPIGADRGVVPADAALVAHVRALLAAGADARARAAALALGLLSDSARVRDDAALALATLPGLPADALLHARLLDALRLRLEQEDTRVPALAEAAARTAPATAAADLLPLYCAAPPAAARALRGVLLRLPARDLGAAFAVAAPADEAGRVRALELLAQTPDPTNVALLQGQLSAARSPRLQLAATEALLAHGLDAAALQPRVDRVVLELAQQRAGAGPPFRAVRPRTTP